MSIVNAREILLKAQEIGYAVGAFNFTNIIQLEAIVETAIENHSPVIIQTSVTPSKFLRTDVITAVYKVLASSTSIPICLHLDHCDDISYCKKCAEAGYTNIMIDASKHKFEENIRQTKEVADYCHSIGDITVEGELGTVAGVEDQVKVLESEAELADPSTVIDYINQTGIDLFAPAIGTAHGVYKTSDPKVDFDRFAKIANKLANAKIDVPLVIHGGTGLPPKTVKKLISLGGSKFNVSTDLKNSLINTTFNYITENRKEFNPGKIDKAVKESIKETVFRWMNLLGSIGKA